MENVDVAQLVPVERYRIETGTGDSGGYTMPVIQFADRRAAGRPSLKWVYQRHVEIVLFDRGDGGRCPPPAPRTQRAQARRASPTPSSLALPSHRPSSGAIWKLLNQTGLGSSAMLIDKKSVAVTQLVTPSESAELMVIFKAHLPSDIVDPCSLGGGRQFTQLPLATAAAVVRMHGRSTRALAFLRGFMQPVPQGWEIREAAEAAEAANVWQPELDEQVLAETEFEIEDLTFADEMVGMGTAFAKVADDESRLKTYTLSPVPLVLKNESAAYVEHRTAIFAAKRVSGAVASATAEGDVAVLLRFFGYLGHTNNMPVDAFTYFEFLHRVDLGDLVQGFAEWLINVQHCKYSR